MRDSVGLQLLDEKAAAMETQISQYLPNFRDISHRVGVQLSIKTKPIGSFDDRSCVVNRDGRIFSVMSGKIDTIFFAVERILSAIESEEIK